MSRFHLIATVVSIGLVLPLAAHLAAGPAESATAASPPMIDREAARIAGPLVNGFVTAWNAHRIAQFDALFWPDSAFIHRGGDLIDGGAAVRDYHAQLHTQPVFATSRITMEIERARRLGPGVVLVTVKSHAWLGPDGKIEVASRPTFVITREGKEWRIAFGQNTELRAPN